MMRLYLDTEFNGHGGELISMALVSADGWWYGVRKPPAVIDPWVAANVVPKLDWPNEGWSDEDFRHTFLNFLTGLPDAEIICDWHADAEHFCHWLDGPTYQQSVDWPFRITILKTPPGQPVSENPHNALADAEALMRWNEARLVI
jgi:hypothetical protein